MQLVAICIYFVAKLTQIIIIIQKKSPLFKMVRINNSRQELSRERVYNFYIENKSLGKRYTINHFKAENFPERTIYSIIERAENEIGPKRVVGSGRIVKNHV